LSLSTHILAVYLHIIQVNTRLKLRGNLFIFPYTQKKQFSHELPLLEAMSTKYPPRSPHARLAHQPMLRGRQWCFPCTNSPESREG